MQEQFVTYEIALKLKELGFDEPCLFAFDTCQMRCKDLRTNKQEFEGVNYNSSTYTSQPLWQQAIDFLKERKVLVAERWDGWEYGAYDWDDFIYTDTKEEAILKAIELIKEN